MKKKKKNLGLAIAGLVINILVLPGVGTAIIGGKTLNGILQLIFWIFGVILVMTIIGAIIGLPLMIAMWIWALVDGINMVKEATE